MKVMPVFHGRFHYAGEDQLLTDICSITPESLPPDETRR